MTDRRFVAVLIGLLVALIGAAVVALSIVALGDPVQATDEGRTIDLSRVLTASIAFGVLLVVAGAGTAIGFVRAQLRRNGVG